MKAFSLILVIASVLCLAGSPAATGNDRSEAHQQYLTKVWNYVDGIDYRSWPQLEGTLCIDVGPRLGRKTFIKQQGDWGTGSEIISEHWVDEELIAVSVFLKQHAGYSQKNRDWYWAHFTADGQVVSASPDKERFRKPGYVTWVIDGRLWVFSMSSKDAVDFVKTGDLAKNVTRIAAGPDRMTVRSSDSEVIDAYLATKNGFFVIPDDGRLWVYRHCDPALTEFLSGNEPAKVVIRPGAGPEGATLKAIDAETLNAYTAARDGFVTFVVDGRIWVFESGTEELEAFQRDGELAKNVTRPGAGPGGMTVRGPDVETLDAYLN